MYIYIYVYITPSITPPASSSASKARACGNLLVGTARIVPGRWVFCSHQNRWLLWMFVPKVDGLSWFSPRMATFLRWNHVYTLTIIDIYNVYMLFSDMRINHSTGGYTSWYTPTSPWPPRFCLSTGTQGRCWQRQQHVPHRGHHPHAVPAPPGKLIDWELWPNMYGDVIHLFIPLYWLYYI